MVLWECPVMPLPPPLALYTTLPHLKGRGGSQSLFNLRILWLCTATPPDCHSLCFIDIIVTVFHMYLWSSIASALGWNEHIQSDDVESVFGPCAVSLHNSIQSTYPYIRHWRHQRLSYSRTQRRHTFSRNLLKKEIIYFLLKGVYCLLHPMPVNGLPWCRCCFVVRYSFEVSAAPHSSTWPYLP